MAATKAVSQTQKNEVASAEDDVFMAGVLAAAKAEQTIRAESGSNLNWITGPLDPSSNVLNEDDEAFIKGAKQKGYVITGKKMNLGTSMDATIIGMFKVYAEMTVPASQGEMAKTVSYWHPQDAEQIPTGENAFERPLSNGNVLKPCHWVFVYLHDKPELEGCVMSFRSIGNKIYSDLEKLVKGVSNIVPELRFTVSSQGIKNEKYNKTYYYPKFELQDQRNFSLSEDGIKTVKGGLEKEEMREILQRYSDCYKAYTEGALVARKSNLASFIPGSQVVAAGAIADDDEGEDINF